MPKKRKSRGRSKGGKGRAPTVQCSNCGALIPRDKAKRVTKTVSIVDPALAKELRAKGAFIPTTRVTKYYCVSCAVHYGIVKIGGMGERRARQT